ncbi:MAG: aminotransferase class I/II-fold pyridoxal phosphate-dependent enzyme [Verrucomicrobiota bacterium]
MPLMDRYPNLIVLRTFSKMYGLAGLRVGYLVGSPQVVELIRRAC